MRWSSMILEDFFCTSLMNLCRIPSVNTIHGISSVPETFSRHILRYFREDISSISIWLRHFSKNIASNFEQRKNDTYLEKRCNHMSSDFCNIVVWQLNTIRCMSSISTGMYTDNWRRVYTIQMIYTAGKIFEFIWLHNCLQKQGASILQIMN